MVNSNKHGEKSTLKNQQADTQWYQEYKDTKIKHNMPRAKRNLVFEDLEDVLLL